VTSVVGSGEWRRLVAALDRADSVVVVGHVNPDPDALGSALALALGLRGAGCAQVQVSFDAEPFAVPRALRWLPGASDLIVAPEQVLAQPDCLVAVDCAAPDRLGRLLEVAGRAGVFAVLDHHRSNPGFGDIEVVASDAPATGVLVARLLDDLGCPRTPDIATNLYAAISSDTGSFRFPATTAQTHGLAAELHRSGIDHSAIATELFASRPIAVARLAGQMMVDAQYEETALHGAGLLIGIVSRADRADLGVSFDEVESLVTDLAAIGDADTAVLLKEDDDGGWRVSARSKGAVDLGAFAASRGGGGHTQAAGYAAAGDAEVISADLLHGLEGFMADR